MPTDERPLDPPDSRLLLQLQEIDTALRDTARLLDPEEAASALAPAQSKADKRQRRAEQAGAELTAARRALKRDEDKLRSVEQEAGEVEQRLYGGSTQSPKEMEQLQQKLASLKSQASDLADTILEQYDPIERLEADLEVLEAGAKKAAQALRKAQADHESEAAQARERSEQLNEARAELVQRIPVEWVERYERLAANKSKAVAQLTDDSCGACRVQVVGAAARSDRLSFCEQCGCILVPPSTH